ncbi:AI-2E family transporter [Corticibacterium sp. UT-5YL-CI-8]|nr:AI-2E family transporter [Tianweitania sp. UT-5YL-CI-8]
MICLIGLVVLASAAYVAGSVIAPAALSLFMIAIIWPLQKTLQRFMPRLLALPLTMIVTIAVCGTFGWLVFWAFGRVGRWVISDAAQLQALYDRILLWLEGHGVSLSGLWEQHFNTAWIVRAVQQITGRLNTTLSFWLVVFIYIILGLLEVADMRRKVLALENRASGARLLAACEKTAAKFRRYMLVRTQMSIVTGVLVWLLAVAAGLPFAAEWGVIAFVLNYIPVIGPFIATMFPTIFAMIQFETWQSVILLFVFLNLIQFVVGSYIEPRISGAALSISPTLVLFSVFFWAYVWGMFGAFIGVPITIAALTFCEHYPSSRWLADLLGGVDRLEQKRSL